MGSEKKTVLAEIYAWFCSLRFTIILLLSIALLSVVGTLLPQGQLPPEYVARISPERLTVYTRLGLFDMYHSWWFIALLFLFSMNLVCCSIKRLPHVIGYIRFPKLIRKDESSSANALESTIEHNQDLEHASAVIFELLKQSFPFTARTVQDGKVHLFAQKNSWSRLGVYVVHFSILLIFAGAIVGALFGFNGYMLLAEGEQSGTVELDNRQRELGFSMRCDSFTVEHYTNGAPRAYRSVLTVLENGKAVDGYAGVKVVVNQPLEYRGIRFYQATYGSAGRFYFNVSTPEGKTAAIEVNGEDAAKLSDAAMYAYWKPHWMFPDIFASCAGLPRFWRLPIRMDGSTGWFLLLNTRSLISRRRVMPTGALFLTTKAKGCIRGSRWSKTRVSGLSGAAAS